MKKNHFVLASLMAIIIATVCGCQTDKKTNDPLSPQTEENISILFSQKDSVHILTWDTQWVRTTPDGNTQAMFCERRVGFGPAVKIKVFRSGNLREVYRKHFTKFDTVSYEPLDSIMNLEIRTREVQPGEYWVIAAADIYLDNQLVRVENDGEQYYGKPMPEEISDIAWTPNSYHATFTSLKELDNYAKKNNCWMVVCSKQTMDLLGWMYEPTECFKLKISGKNFPVLKLETWSEKVEWEPVHIHYRYLCISWGGRDIEYGPGVSAFNVKDNNNPGSIEDDDFVRIDHNGIGYYYGEKVKSFSLNNFKGI